MSDEMIRTEGYVRALREHERRTQAATNTRIKALEKIERVHIAMAQVWTAEGSPADWSADGLRLILRSQQARIKELEAERNADRAVCICGCPPSEHTSYGEDGECCEHDDHECIRVCVAARDITDGLRGRIKALENAIEWRDQQDAEYGIGKTCRETATAIARFATTYAAETQSDAGQSVRVVGLEQILQACRAHGAVV